MRYWKRMTGLVLILALMFVLSCAGTAFAVEVQPGEERVYDMADLFTDREEADLAAAIVMLQEKMDMGIAIVTTEENRGSARDFADDFYEEYDIGFGNNHDGALFLIDMENGELWISTEGKMIRYLTDGRIEAILDDAIEYAYDGDFYGAAEVFLEDVEICYNNGISSDQYNYDTQTGKVDRYKSIQWYEFLIALVASAAVAGIAVSAVIREYGMKDDSVRMAANFNLSYRKDSAFTMGAALADVMLGSHVTRTLIRTQSGPPRGGGGGPRPSGGGRSLSSGGRSSTHRSSSGRSHGGGGRKFR